MEAESRKESGESKNKETFWMIDSIFLSIFLFFSLLIFGEAIFFYFLDNGKDDVWNEVHREGLWAELVNKYKIPWLSFHPLL